jgi:hypothetical protein
VDCLGHIDVTSTEGKKNLTGGAFSPAVYEKGFSQTLSDAPSSIAACRSADVNDQPLQKNRTRVSGFFGEKQPRCRPSPGIVTPEFGN